MLVKGYSTFFKLQIRANEIKCFSAYVKRIENTRVEMAKIELFIQFHFECSVLRSWLFDMFTVNTKI